MKHKHYDIIIAWAAGKDVQWNNNGVWHNLIDDRPHWHEFTKYRIKPTPKPDWYKFVRVDTTCGHITKWQSCSPAVANLHLAFDGETGELKSAEVLK